MTRVPPAPRTFLAGPFSASASSSPSSSSSSSSASLASALASDGFGIFTTGAALADFLAPGFFLAGAFFFLAGTSLAGATAAIAPSTGSPASVLAAVAFFLFAAPAAGLLTAASAAIFLVATGHIEPSARQSDDPAIEFSIRQHAQYLAKGALKL